MKKRLKNKAIKLFAKNEFGGLSVFFAIVLIPLIIILGVTVEYGQSYRAHQILTKASDAASLAAAKIGPNASKEDIKMLAKQIFKANLEGSNLNPDDVKIEIQTLEGQNKIVIHASTNVESTLMRVVGIKSTKVATSVTAMRAITDLEVILALDDTASMRTILNGDKKMNHLKRAVKQFIHIAFDDKTERDSIIKIGLVPWTYNVNLGSYISGSSFPKFACKGMSYENGDYKDGSKSWLSHQHLCPSMSVVDLTENAENLTTVVDAFKHEGATDINSGLHWAGQMLDPNNNYFTLPRATYDDIKTRKVIILLSDGGNYGIRSAKRKYPEVDPDHVGDVFDPDKHVGTGRRDEEFANYELQGLERYNDLMSDTGYKNSMNGTVLKKCRDLKSRGIVIYTIAYGLDEPEDVERHAKKLLQLCATNTGSSTVKNFYDVERGDGLTEAFAEIAASVLRLQLIN